MVTRRRAAPEGTSEAPTVRVLKKYPNRRLYDTQASAYVTLADVKAMVLAGESFEVRDAKNGEDITRSILLQIILEEETAGAPMFSTPMLEQIIRFYGQAMQGVLQDYLAKNLQTFSDLQSKFTGGAPAGMAFTPEQWTQFMQGQAPMMQGLMGEQWGSYLEQSQAMFKKMQENMGGGLGGGLGAGAGLFTGMPGFGKK
jgi:polyhydroxyalkanoate synthesis repressor PhaR